MRKVLLIFCCLVLVAVVQPFNVSDDKYQSLVFFSKLKYLLNKNNFLESFTKIYHQNSDNNFRQVGQEDTTRSVNNRYNDTLCQLQLQYFSTALSGFEFWAINMFDSWGKIPSGILNGNTNEFGNFDQCLEILEQPEDVSISEIKGQYCLTRISDGSETLASLLAINIGVCLPASCSPGMIKSNLDTLLDQLGVVANIPRDCYTDDKHDFSAVDYVAIVFFSIIICLLLTSTTYDVMMRHCNHTPSQLLASFSLYTNGQRLLSCKKSKSPDVMHCLNGIRVMSMVWVVFGHSYSQYVDDTAMNFMVAFTWIGSWFSMLLLYATFAVDSFFVMSGLLMTWGVMKELDKNRKINVPLMYLHRYLRLTPSMAALILLYVSLLKYSGTGPIWNVSFTPAMEYCEQYWWSGLLYVQNYVNVDRICLGQTWYLSVDMQLFLLAPLFIYPLWRWKNKFVGVIVLFILLSSGCVFAISYQNEFKVGSRDIEKLQERMMKIYYTTHTRLGTYLIGVLLGYILHLLRNKPVRLSWIWVSAGWVATIGIMYGVLYGPIDTHQVGYVEGRLESPIYESLSRIGWAVALCWIIFACVKGYAGPVNWFLSLAVWQPFARLSYSIYMLHLLVQNVMKSSIRTTFYFSDIRQIHVFWGDIGFTLTIGLLWALAFESPITILEKYIIPRRKPTQSKENLVIKDSPKAEIVPAHAQNNTVVVEVSDKITEKE